MMAITTSNSISVKADDFGREMVGSESCRDLKKDEDRRGECGVH